MSPTSPLILLSGMGADQRLFSRQQAAFPNFSVPGWIEPNPQECLSAYGARLAQVIDPGVPCFVGGASFGGIVALEMAAHLQTIACFLIASIRSPAQLPWQMRILRPLCRFSPATLREGTARLLRFSKPAFSKKTARRLQQYSRPEATFLRWASLAVLAWEPARQPTFPIYQIHGEFDRTFPVRLTKPDVIVLGGDHLLPFSASEQVNDFLHDHMRKYHLEPDAAYGERG